MDATDHEDEVFDHEYDTSFSTMRLNKEVWLNAMVVNCSKHI